MTKKRKTTMTKKAIAAEITRLRKLKPKVRRYSFFGDDNHVMIDAQISVLETNMSDYDIGRTFSGESQAEAFNARDWLVGDAEKAPSKGWKELVK